MTQEHLAHYKTVSLINFKNFLKIHLRISQFPSVGLPAQSTFCLVYAMEGNEPTRKQRNCFGKKIRKLNSKER